jgi:hypothetical protein
MSKGPYSTLLCSFDTVHGGEGMMNGNIGCKSEMFSQVDFEKEEALSVSGKDARGMAL